MDETKYYLGEINYCHISLNRMRQDLRDAFRGLRRAPTFTFVAVITLTLAIGSTTAVFSVVDAVLIRGLPYAEPDRLQAIYERGENGALRVPSYPTFRES